MERKKTICEYCDREIGKHQKPRLDGRHLVCPTCNKILMDSQIVIRPIIVKDATYPWLRIPSVLLGSIGLLGILPVKFQAAASMLSFFRMPSVGMCCLIVAGSATLFVLSITVVKETKKTDVVQAVPEHLHESWRSQ